MIYFFRYKFDPYEVEMRTEIEKHSVILSYRSTSLITRAIKFVEMVILVFDKRNNTLKKAFKT